jgi:hypothetical protein
MDPIRNSPRFCRPLQIRVARLKQFSGHASLKSLEEYVELGELRHNHPLKDILLPGCEARPVLAVLGLIEAARRTARVEGSSIDSRVLVRACASARTPVTSQFY